MIENDRGNANCNATSSDDRDVLRRGEQQNEMPPRGTYKGALRARAVSATVLAYGR
ncbi:MAG TPA: hypothetical protein VM261_04695 [Kofleriaceae bacterium]|nr:hypothetical protein [Kofleriaceae bacterium]